jgi:hypothetical protein
MAGTRDGASGLGGKAGRGCGLAWLLLLAGTGAGCAGTGAPDSAPRPAAQNPSPMVEHTRAHGRVAPRAVPGRADTVTAGLERPVRLFVPEGVDLRSRPDLVVHFHGASFVTEAAAAATRPPAVVATVHIGAGSGTYDRAFSDPAAFDRLLAAIEGALHRMAGQPVAPGRLTLSAFSAGYGAVRAVLRDSAHFERVDAVLLLDGLHTGYLPPGTVLHQGGRLDTARLGSLLQFADAAADGRKGMLITHSEIFPGTFASTTEATDHLIDALGLRRRPVLRWGPVGMQQLSEVRRGGLEIRGFAGNTAPDHVDHFHGLEAFLSALGGLPAPDD